MTLEELNNSPAEAYADTLAQCCASRQWVSRMVTARPFSSADHLLSRAAEIWWELGETDYMEAFDAHPKIGDMNSLKARYASTEQMAQGEQSGAANAEANVLERLSEGNAAYEERFGFIFIVCATGKSAAEMTAMLETRLSNTREIEIKLAAAEQLKITKLRLQKLL